jgi:YD repeat-containing protein
VVAGGFKKHLPQGYPALPCAAVTDQNGKTTTYAYDDADRLTSVTDAANHVTTYGYDTEDNLTSIKNTNNNTSFTLTHFGMSHRPIFRPATSTYNDDAVGNRTSKTDRKNHFDEAVAARGVPTKGWRR